MQPTKEQKRILSEARDCVVIAKPGSGKTFTLALKIRAILAELPEYKGVVAISFTNKASDELQGRCLSGGVARKASFFGTIDKFFLTEIVIPFGRQIFGDPKEELSVVEAESESELDLVGSILDSGDYAKVVSEYLSELSKLYVTGRVVLEAFGFMAMYVFNNSRACRRYLRARYSHLVVDEYQDCGFWQHALFVRLCDLGLRAIVVGDLDQSIFAFARKDPKYLVELARDSERFVLYPLSKNHRCHRSIVNYSARLLSASSVELQTSETRVYECQIEGSEAQLAEWIDREVGRLTEVIDVVDMSRVAVLFRGRRTGNLVHQNLSIPHKAVVPTPLDTEPSLWGALFRKVLGIAFARERTKFELAEEYLSLEYQTREVRKVMKLVREIVEIAENNADDLKERIGLFIEVARMVLPAAANDRAIDSLSRVLSSRSLLGSFIPAGEDEVQLMTLHRSKGLEFDLVFHLDLYRFIMPKYKCTEDEYVQDLNLHYVGITRARNAVVLCTSTYRHNSEGSIVRAEPSEFMYLNGVEQMRVEWK